MAHILVIEDEKLLLRDIVELLEYSEHRVRGAATGEEGLALARAEAPDLIMCDIGLRGELDGYQVLEQVRAEGAASQVRFVFMSARADPESKTLGLEKGADGYLTKPFAANDLLDTIDRLLSPP